VSSEGKLSLNMSNGATMQITAWDDKTLSLQYTAKNDNSVLLNDGKDLKCTLKSTASSSEVTCDRIKPTAPPTSKLPTQERELGEKDIIGIVVAVVLTILMVVVVGALIIRGNNRKNNLARGVDNEAANDGYDSEPNNVDASPVVRNGNDAVSHKAIVNKQHAATNERTEEAETPTIMRKPSQSTYL